MKVHRNTLILINCVVYDEQLFSLKKGEKSLIWNRCQGSFDYNTVCVFVCVLVIYVHLLDYIETFFFLFSSISMNYKFHNRILYIVINIRTIWFIIIILFDDLELQKCFEFASAIINFHHVKLKLYCSIYIIILIDWKLEN